MFMVLEIILIKNVMVIPSLMVKKTIIKKKTSRGLGRWITDQRLCLFCCGHSRRNSLRTMVYGTGKYDFLNLGSGEGVSIKKLIETNE